MKPDILAEIVRNPSKISGCQDIFAAGLQQTQAAHQAKTKWRTEAAGRKNKQLKK